MNLKFRNSFLLIALAMVSASHAQQKSETYQDFNPGDTAELSDWIKAIEIIRPPLRSEVKGDVTVEFKAPGMKSARALCWQQPTQESPDPMGHDAILADLKLGSDGKGSFVFPAEKFPSGPISIRILAQNESGKKDIREIQLFNKGGVVWKQGIPGEPPPAAKGMKLVFADDFEGPLSISRTGEKTRYGSHKPGGGDFSGWPFSDFEGPHNPFSQVGTFLRIHASKKSGTHGSTGLLSSVAMDGTGFYASAPCYFEARFTAQSAPGTWAAFWTLTKGSLMERLRDPKSRPACDELDIVEAYGGVGPGTPNSPGYSVTSHFWFQKDSNGKPLKNIHKRVLMTEIGGQSFWSTTFHTYAVKVTKDETIYYLDDIEVQRHPTGEISKTQPHFFMINYAMGGISGWKIDLEREGNASDMWVDYVRVYEGE